MKKFTGLFLLFCFIALTFSGCGRNKTADPLCRVVTGVDIFCQHENVQIRRHYTDTQKMEWVLIYLRLLKPRSNPKTDPESIDADVYNITLHFSDSTKKTYRQKDHRYLSKDAGPWQTIDPGKAAGLYALMRYVPSDPATSTTTG